MMAEDKRASERCGPIEMLSKFEPEPSLPFTVLTNFSRMSLFT
jgi:hypothetical protein